MTSEQTLYLIVQGGSFAVLVLIILWVGRVLVPTALAAFREQGERYEKIHERNEARHAAELAKRDEQFERLTDVVGALANRVEKIEERTGEHKPLR
ncbi:MAG TPA: hypothetical protein VGE74_30010 [Gemmata sp.]